MLVRLLALNLVMKDALAERYVSFVFFWEAVGLEAFGLSWLTTSHFLPFLNTHTERFRPFALRYAPPVEAPGKGEMDGG